jgi:serine protease AprX
MKTVVFLMAELMGTFLLVNLAKSEEAAQSPAGRWQSVDYVQNIEDFKPGQKSWKGDLFLKEIKFLEGGTTSLGFRWENGFLMHDNGKTKAEYYIRQMGDSTYLFLPWLSGDVTERGQKPWYYVLTKASGEEQPAVKVTSVAGNPRGAFRAIETVDTVKEFDNVRWKDLSKIRPEVVTGVISTLTFNEKTVWPDINTMQPGKRPQALLKKAMNPGLGVGELHKQGITGKGVNVAIIDQPLYQDHPEFAGKIAAYYDTGCKSESSMHGPAVASLLVGTNCGTAPDANLYYAAAPSWLKDAQYYSKAIDWIIEQNTKLPAGEKIRVISVSAAPSGQGSPFDKNQQMWDQAFSRAEAAGILVLDCTEHHGIIAPGRINAEFPEDVNKCMGGHPDDTSFQPMEGRIYAPTCPRTTAEQYDKDEFSYQYCGKGGLSWAIPYVSGVLAMGWQVNPDLGPEDMRGILFKSATQGQNGAKIIDPQKFITMVKSAKPGSVGVSTRVGKKSNGSIAASQNPVGKWQTVDYVRQMGDFNPNAKSYSGELFIKELEFMVGGKTSGVWTWRAGSLFRPDERTNSKYVIKEIDGDTYMFMEWITGDVTIRGEKPWYCVLKRVSGGEVRLQRRR